MNASVELEFGEEGEGVGCGVGGRDKVVEKEGTTG